jgi:hypothetical protein
MQIQAEGAGRRLHAARDGRGNGSCWIDQQGKAGGGGDELVQQLQLLRRQLRAQGVTPVSSRPAG